MSCPRSIPFALVLCLTAQTALADPCVIGNWQADIGDVADMMAVQMNGSAEALGGTVTMAIGPEMSVYIATDGMEIAVTPPNVPTVAVTVTGYSRGTLTFDGSGFNALINDYTLVGSADVLGQRMEIPFDSASGMFGTTFGTYACDGNALRFEPDPSLPGASLARVWRRIGG